MHFLRRCGPLRIRSLAGPQISQRASPTTRTLQSIVLDRWVEHRPLLLLLLYFGLVNQLQLLPQVSLQLEQGVPLLQLTAHLQLLTPGLRVHFRQQLFPVLSHVGDLRLDLAEQQYFTCEYPERRSKSYLEKLLCQLLVLVEDFQGYSAAGIGGDRTHVWLQHQMHRLQVKGRIALIPQQLLVKGVRRRRLSAQSVRCENGCEKESSFRQEIDRNEYISATLSGLPRMG